MIEHLPSRQETLGSISSTIINDSKKGGLNTENCVGHSEIKENRICHSPLWKNRKYLVEALEDSK